MAIDDILAIQSGLSHFFSSLRGVFPLTSPCTFSDFIFKRYGVVLTMHAHARLGFLPGWCVLQKYVVALIVVAHIETAHVTAFVTPIASGV